MAKLTTDERNNLPDSEFALPGRHYPIEDKGHAKAALSEISQHGTADEEAKVRAAVRSKFKTMSVQRGAKK